MTDPDPHRSRATNHPARGILVATAALAWMATEARGAAAALTQDDVALAVYASDGTGWRALGSKDLGGFFGPHRCRCPDFISPELQLTDTGKTGLGTSTLTVNFLHGANCFTTPAACVSVGQVTFSASQSATSPQFSSSLVFQAAEGSATVDCENLVTKSTTLWAVLAQDGGALSIAPAIDLPVITTTVAAPTAVTAQPANQGLLVTWTPPADTSLVAGYQVLCLPRPAASSAAGYESCGLASSTDGSIMTPGDSTQLCSTAISVGINSVRLAGLTNGTPYTVAVIAIDPSGGVSALSPQAVAMPQPTEGFYEKYKQVGGTATGCALSPPPRGGRAGLLWVAIAAALVVAPGRRKGRGQLRRTASFMRALVLLLAFGTTARAQDFTEKSTDDWASKPATSDITLPPDWGIEIGLSLYRPAVDSEFGGGVHPFADTFSNSRHMMSEVELDRYLLHAVGSLGVGLRVGYYKVTGTAFLSDGVTRSGDQTSLRLIPFSLSALYRADGLPGLRRVPLIPYAKVGLDGVMWTGTSTGGSASRTGFTPGWHVAAGMALGLNFLGLGAVRPGEVAGPCALFFEWDYAAINGLGLGDMLHVGDSTGFAGLMFDL